MGLVHSNTSLLIVNYKHNGLSIPVLPIPIHNTPAGFTKQSKTVRLQSSDFKIPDNLKDDLKNFKLLPLAKTIYQKKASTQVDLGLEFDINSNIPIALDAYLELAGGTLDLVNFSFVSLRMVAFNLVLQSFNYDISKMSTIINMTFLKQSEDFKSGVSVESGGKTFL